MPTLSRILSGFPLRGFSVDTLDAAAFRLSLLLFFLLPFKTLQPLARVHGWPVTPHLPLLAAALLLWGLSALRRAAARPAWREGLPALLVALALLSALITEADRGLCLRAGVRLALSVAFYHMTRGLFRDPARRTRAFQALGLSAVVAAAAGIWEAFGGEAARRALSLFKEAPTWYDGYVRAGGTFPYATIFSMHQEACLPFVLRCFGPWGAGLGLAGILLSSTRAGVGAAAVCLLGLLWFSRDRVSQRTVWAAVLVCLGFVVCMPDRLWPRIQTIRQELFASAPRPRVGYKALSYPAALGRGESGLLRLSCLNLTGRTWPAETRLLRRWFALSPEDKNRDMGGAPLPPEEFPLGQTARHGQAVVVEIPITCPSDAGWHRVRYDIRLPPGLLLSTLGAFAPVHTVFVPEEGPWRWEPSTPDRIRDDVRPVLWAAALGMWARHPWLGAGPDAFRQLSARYSGSWIQMKDVYANNLYLQWLAEGGLLGTAVFFGFCLAVVRRAVRTPRQDPGTGAFPSEKALLLASLSTWFTHGLLDYFHWYFPLNLLFWGTLGLLSAEPRK